MFDGIEIDIYNLCNRKCEYCPNSKFEIKPHKIDERLFYNIIDQLADIKYNGTIYLHGYGEPLLDNRLDKFIRYINEKCKFASINLYTNGDFLDYKRFKQLLKAGVDFFSITQHSNKLNKANLSLLNNAPPTKFSFKMGAQLCLNNRAGIFKSKKNDYFKNRPCLLPSNSLVITPFGKIVLCCNDYHSKIVLGDLNKQSLMEIWKSKRFKEIRKELANGNREIFEICKNCDY